MKKEEERRLSILALVCWLLSNQCSPGDGAINPKLLYYAMHQQCFLVVCRPFHEEDFCVSCVYCLLHHATTSGSHTQVLF